MFFDDILVYSQSKKDHLEHLQRVLERLLSQQFFAKLSKCQFFQSTVEYLGHLVTGGGVQVDPRKSSAMLSWPLPQTLKQLRRFLGLTRYYRRFVRNYATIATPFIELLKKDAFHWTLAATMTFDSLKQVLSELPQLHLPDFSKEFVIETDASKTGIGSKKPGPRMQLASTYVRERFALTEAVAKWCQYLWGWKFIIRTSHKDLKELLTQVIQTPEHQYFLRKLLGYHFIIEYKSSQSNAAADSFSRIYEDNMVDEAQHLSMAIFTLHFDLIDVLRHENQTLLDLLELHTSLQGESGL